jgi:ComF family protein
MDHADLVCGSCIAEPPRHDGVRAAVAYGDIARRMVIKLKHGRKIGIAESIAKLAARHVIDTGADIIAPVPLHKWRLWSRGFNQSLLIARNLPISAKSVLIPDLLIRSRATPMLKGLGRRQRAKTVAGAFRINPKHQAALAGRTVSLVDDVYTTGATTNACASALKKAGATRVDVICWARVLDDEY